MICIAFERFCAVWFPHHHKVIFTHRKIFFLVLGIFFGATLISTWFLFVVKMVLKTRPANITNITTLSLKSSFKFVY